MNDKGRYDIICTKRPGLNDVFSIWDYYKNTYVRDCSSELEAELTIKSLDVYSEVFWDESKNSWIKVAPLV